MKNGLCDLSALCGSIDRRRPGSRFWSATPPSARRRRLTTHDSRLAPRAVLRFAGRESIETVDSMGRLGGGDRSVHHLRLGSAAAIEARSLGTEGRADALCPLRRDGRCRQAGHRLVVVDALHPGFPAARVADRRDRGLLAGEESRAMMSRPSL